MSRRATVGRVVAGLIALVMVAAACGGDDGGSSAGGEGSEGTRTPATTTAPGPEPEVDPLAPQPLPTETTVRMVLSARIEAFAQPILTDALGEFAKENIELEILDVSSLPDGIALLATGRGDLMPTSPSAGMLNAIEGGATVRMVAPTFTPNPDSRSGLWVRSELAGDGASGEDFDIASLRGLKIASSGGEGSPAGYTMNKILEQGGLGLTDVEIVRVSAAEQILALETGAVDGAYLLDPFWLEAESGTAATFVAGADPDVSLGGIFFGPALLDGDPAVGDAVLRAIARTTRDYLQGDYHADDEVVDTLVEVLGVPREALVRTPSLVFDPEMEISVDVISELQELYLEEGSVGYPAPMPIDEIVDTSFWERVLGSQG